MKSSFCGEYFDDFIAGFFAYSFTSLLVLLGVLFGTDFLHPNHGFLNQRINPIIAYIHFDAWHYLQIIRDGYSYDPARRSSVAFFPAYPLLSRWLNRGMGLPPEESASLISHASLLAAFVLLARYVRLRWPEAKAPQRGFVLAVFGLWPMGLFFRMPYTESLFLCGILAALYGMARGWPLAVLALLAGFVTAVCPVGVALTAAFLWYTLVQPGIRPRAKIGRALLLAPLACWGLLAYMIYQWLTFGTPLAFAQTQQHWNMRAPQDHSWSAKLWSLTILEPIWGVYVPGYRRYWANVTPRCGPLFSLMFWNPILFVLAVVLLVWGGWKRWLDGRELVLGAGLLAIPYATRGYEMSMASHGRFAAVVVVNYLVIGRIFGSYPPLVRTALCVTLALFLFIFTALYATNHLVF